MLIEKQKNGVIARVYSTSGPVGWVGVLREASLDIFSATGTVLRGDREQQAI